MPEPLTIEELLRVGTRVLSDSTAIFDDHDNSAEARELLALTLDVDADDVDDLDSDLEPPRRKREKYLSLVARRASGEPMPFIRGYIEFFGLDLHVKPGAFVPRPSSELTVEHALKRLRRKRSPVVVDVCAGSAPMGLAIAHEKPDSTVWAMDILAEGITQGRNNARRLGIHNIHFGTGDVYDPLPNALKGEVDMIVAHVPYVPAPEVEDLPEEVREHEPWGTLTDESDDGTFLMRRVVNEGWDVLRDGGWMLLELSDDMIGKSRKIYKAAGFRDPGVIRDEDDLSVVVEARKNPK